MQGARDRKLYGEMNLRIIFGITLVAVMGVAVIAPAFPQIVDELGITAREVGLLITWFTLPGVLLTPVLGVLADRYGRRRILVPALILFGLAGGSCTFIRDFDLLLVLRFFQGVGAASLGSLNITIIGDIYEGPRRTAALGYNASVLSIGTASYPAVGGALAMLGWHIPFAMSFLALPLAALVWFRLDNPEPDQQSGMREYLANAWLSVRSLRAAGLFVAVLLTFIVLYGSYLTFFPILLGNSFGASSGLIGLIMSSTSLTTAITSSQAGRIGSLCSRKCLMLLSFCLMAAAMLIVPAVPVTWMFLAATITFGMAMGVNMPVVQGMLTELAPIQHRAAFMSVNGLVLRLGQTVGPLVTREVYQVWGIETVFYAGAAFALLAVVLLAFAIR